MFDNFEEIWKETPSSTATWSKINVDVNEPPSTPPTCTPFSLKKLLNIVQASWKRNRDYHFFRSVSFLPSLSSWWVKQELDWQWLIWESYGRKPEIKDELYIQPTIAPHPLSGFLGPHFRIGTEESNWNPKLWQLVMFASTVVPEIPPTMLILFQIEKMRKQSFLRKSWCTNPSTSRSLTVQCWNCVFLEIPTNPPLESFEKKKLG